MAPTQTIGSPQARNPLVVNIHAPLSILHCTQEYIFQNSIFRRNIRSRIKAMALRFQSLLSGTARPKSARAVSSLEISIAGDDSYAFTPLAAVADAFEELSAVVKTKGLDHDLDLNKFCDACSLVSVLFGCLGIAFKFAELEYVSKVRDLTEASQSHITLNSVLDYDKRNNSVRTPGSLSRNLRRVRQGLDLIRALFINFLSSNDVCLKDAASSAYAKTCAPYHTWAVRTAAYAGMYALPTRDQLLLKLNETDKSARKEMTRYINASLPIIEYVDKLYISRHISLDW